MEDLCNIAWQFADANSKMPSAWRNNQKAGHCWARAFRKRHSLSPRNAESTSIARASAFNPINVKLFDDVPVYKIAVEKFPFQAMNIWNLDETGVLTVTKIPKLIAPRGDNQVSGITSGERGALVAVCACVNAAGRALSPVMIYPRKKVQQLWALSAPPGTLTLAKDSGWMTNELFPLALNHFLQQMGGIP